MKYLKSIIEFTKNLIDYAGLFPPAKLDIHTAFKNHLEYISTEYKWMISKFICPVNLFGELENILSHKPYKLNKVFLSALGRSSENKETFEKNFCDDLILWEDFIAKTHDKVKISSYEVKLPEETLISSDIEYLTSTINFLSSSIEKNISQPVFSFFEGSSADNWKENFKSLINSISVHNESKFNSGFKLRTGGVEAHSIPSAEQIAFCIRECLDRKVPVKFTAGLHHPFRHYDKTVRAKMHGFINVFGAGIIAMRHNLSNKGIEEMLMDEDPENFIFTDEYFSWKDWKAEIEDIKFARENLVISFGSCSFDEPVEDLKLLKLL